MAARQAQRRARDRSVLVNLLAPIDRNTAERWATALLAEFGSLAAVFGGGRRRIERALGGRREPTAHLLAVRRAMRLAVRAQLHDRPLMNDWGAIYDRLMLELAHEPIEIVHILYFDARRCLIRDERTFRGTIDAAPFSIRGVLARALELGASALVVAHNHPAGNPTPSTMDIDLTRKLIGAAREVGISVWDHLVIGTQGVTSMYDEKLI